VWATEPVWVLWKDENLASSEIRTPAVQPVARRYIDVYIYIHTYTHKLLLCSNNVIAINVIMIFFRRTRNLAIGK
jgi:hypothetical protein